MVQWDNKQAPYTGQLVEIGQLMQGRSKSGQEWKRRTFVLQWQDPEGYEHELAFNTFGAVTDQLGKYNPGDLVTVSFSIQSKEFGGKWYTNLNAYKLEYSGPKGKRTFARNPEPQQGQQVSSDVINQLRGDDGDLPF